MNSYNYMITSNGELYHYGVKGMKWGVRRFQNADGSLTPAGKRKLAKQSDERLARKLTVANDKMTVNAHTYRMAMAFVNANRAKKINTWSANQHAKRFDRASREAQTILSELDRRGVTLKEIESIRSRGDYSWVGTKYVIDSK